MEEDGSIPVKNVERGNRRRDKDKMKEKQVKVYFENTTLGRRREKRETMELFTPAFSVAKVGEYVKSKHSAFNGVIERVTEDAYIIASWYNPDTDIRVAHQRVPFSEIAIAGIEE